ncbi:hypothetical protein PLICRDRAFT_78414, partial [Plicaturopsis crispa FD-325 SS-3]
LNKSSKAHFDLINSAVHKDYDILAIQEPYLDSFANTKATSKWRVVYPSSRFADKSTVRSVLLVNTRLDTNHWRQLSIHSNDITALQLSGDFGNISIINIYNDCTHSRTLELLERHL